MDDLLVSTCKTMIRTILSCLDNAFKGTIYRIGLMPELTSERITSGIRNGGREDIQWGLPAISDYNFPGKTWEQYRDQPDRPLEAMGWCVEKQLPWTAENPMDDVRSVRKQLSGEPEDFYHMEPVLVRKKSLYGNSLLGMRYPVDWTGKEIWRDTEYAVAAVIKIHFLPGTVKRGDRATHIIRELSRSLGAELLSLWFRESLSRARKDFDRQRLQTCEILAHELRNTLVKLGFVFSAINAQISILREGWEDMLRSHVPGLEWKSGVIEELSGKLNEKRSELKPSSKFTAVYRELLKEQEELAKLSLSPHQELEWVRNKIHPKWESLLKGTTFWDKEEIVPLLNRLSDSLRTGLDFDTSSKINGLPLTLTEKWARLAYVQITSGNLSQIDEIIELVEQPALPVSHKEQILRVLKSLRALVYTIPEVEEKATRLLQSLRHGSWTEEQYRLEPGSLDFDESGDLEVVLSD